MTCGWTGTVVLKILNDTLSSILSQSEISNDRQCRSNIVKSPARDRKLRLQRKCSSSKDIKTWNCRHLKTWITYGNISSGRFGFDRRKGTLWPALNSCQRRQVVRFAKFGCFGTFNDPSCFKACSWNNYNTDFFRPVSNLGKKYPIRFRLKLAHVQCTIFIEP